MTYLGLASVGRAATEQLKEPTDNEEDFRRQGVLQEINREITKAAVDAAAIIYAHAILDANLYKLCEISASIDADGWLPKISRKTVTFEEIRSSSASKIASKLVASHLEKLERKSLLKKCDSLLGVIRPKRTRGLVKKFHYSRERLETIDQLRHDLVHKLQFHRKVKQVDIKIRYLFNTGEFFYRLLAEYYGIRITEDKLLAGVIPIAHYDNNILKQIERAMKHREGSR